MKKIVRPSIDVKLEFKKNTPNPSRLFQSFAKVIEGLNKIDNAIASTIDSTVASTMYLEDIKEGSLIAKIWNELVIGEDEQLDNMENKEDSISNFIKDARSETLKVASKENPNAKDIKEVTDKIEQISRDNGLDISFNSAPLNQIKLASGINEIKTATSSLGKGERFILDNGSDNPRQINNSPDRIDLEEVENLLTKEEMENKFQTYYKIKRPDFLGSSQWEFKNGNEKIIAKITDEEWLKKYQQGEIIVVPQDSLHVEVTKIDKFDKNLELISSRIEVTKVIKVIKTK